MKRGQVLFGKQMLRSSARGNHGVHRTEATHQRFKVINFFNVLLQKQENEATASNSTPYQVALPSFPITFS